MWWRRWCFMARISMSDPFRKGAVEGAGLEHLVYLGAGGPVALEGNEGHRAGDLARGTHIGRQRPKQWPFRADRFCFLCHIWMDLSLQYGIFTGSSPALQACIES